MATELDMVKGQIEMLREAIADAPIDGEDKRREVLARYEARAQFLAANGGGVTLPSTDGEGRPINWSARPKAGAAASNQFGTFKVAYATEPQHRFIQALLERKNIGELATAQPPLRPIDPADVIRMVMAREVNKKAASNLIDRLLGCSDRPGTTSASGARKASDKQLGLIRKLLAERAIDAADKAKVEAAIDTLSTKGASATIDKLMTLLPKPTTPARELEAGVYTDGTTILRVYLGQRSGQLLAKQVVQVDDEYELEYLGRADRFVTDAFRRMSLDEAKAWGRTTSTCCVCAARLDDPKSVDAGIGPICATRV